MLYEIKQQIAEALKKVGVKNAELTTPPNSEMGDIAFGCFEIAKQQKKNPTEVAKELAEKLNEEFAKEDMKQSSLIASVEAVGPYVNFFLDEKETAQFVLNGIEKQGEKYGQSDLLKGKKYMVEFAHPNTHKMFHIGHLRNITTGESIVRILKNAGCKVIRANYQGDVGMHIAKSLWGIEQLKNEYEEVKDKGIHERVEFLGKAYALGGTKYEEDKKVQKQVAEINKKIYSKDKSIREVYEETRSWSLEYFEHIYRRVGSHFDRLYFESEVFEEGEKIVRKFLKKGIFQESEGAIIFPGSKYGLHDRVFITSLGFPGYEAKEMALGKMQFSEFDPDKIIHVVAREQSGYFEVVFKALEQTLPKSKGKEKHLIYGWVHLKDGKMSSRTGKVVLGEWLLDEVKAKIQDIMKDSKVEDKKIAEKVAVAAVKYAFLKLDISKDIAFDLEESVSTSGDSGPYLLYIVARIKSILVKCNKQDTRNKQIQNSKFKIQNEEKHLLLKLAEYPEVTRLAVEEYDPSKISKYLFELAQTFNAFYTVCPVLKAEEDIQAFRIDLIKKVEQVMTKGLDLLGIETVEEM